MTDDLSFEAIEGMILSGKTLDESALRYLAKHPEFAFWYRQRHDQEKTITPSLPEMR